MFSRLDQRLAVTQRLQQRERGVVELLVEQVAVDAVDGEVLRLRGGNRDGLLALAQRAPQVGDRVAHLEQIERGVEHDARGIPRRLGNARELVRIERSCVGGIEHLDVGPFEPGHVHAQLAVG